MSGSSLWDVDDPGVIAVTAFLAHVDSSRDGYVLAGVTLGVAGGGRRRFGPGGVLCAGEVYTHEGEVEAIVKLYYHDIG